MRVLPVSCGGRASVPLLWRRAPDSGQIRGTARAIGLGASGRNAGSFSFARQLTPTTTAASEVVPEPSNGSRTPPPCVAPTGDEPSSRWARCDRHCGGRLCSRYGKPSEVDHSVPVAIERRAVGIALVGHGPEVSRGACCRIPAARNPPLEPALGSSRPLST